MAILFPPRFIDQINSVIIENMDNENFCIENFSQKVALSNAQIYRKIKQQTGLSPSLYVRKIRLEYSKQLIENSDFNLSEIAYSVGFSSLSYFSRCFSQFYGYAPSNLRK